MTAACISTWGGRRTYFSDIDISVTLALSTATIAARDREDAAFGNERRKTGSSSELSRSAGNSYYLLCTPLLNSLQVRTPTPRYTRKIFSPSQASPVAPTLFHKPADTTPAGPEGFAYKQTN